ncbi:MAG: alpha/beta hydrolase [Hyphomicrobiaceae bacterium]|nr:alpha/beta hydrolase [Hyphomicrobiaceae bacterium]
MRARAIEFTGAHDNRLVGDLYAGEHCDGVALFLHGGGQTRHAWDSAVRRLALRGMATIALDQRGHGDSAWVGSGHYAFEDYAADLARVSAAIVERFGRRPLVVGASLGGIAGLMAEGEAAAPLAEALVLVDIVPRMDPNGVSRIQGFMRDRVAEGFGSIEEAAEAVAAYLPHRPRPKSLSGLAKNLRQSEDGRWRWHWDPRFLDGPRPINTGMETLVDRLEAASRRLRLPVLLVRGGQSELVSEDDARAFLDLVPTAEMADVSGAGHMVAGDRNDVFAEAVFGFVERLTGT